MIQSAADHDEQTIKAAIQAFRRHHLIDGSYDNGRWFIARKYDDGTIDGTYATEIISLRGGRLFVGGDIDDCVFAYYSGPKDSPYFHEHKLSWIGRCQDVSYYVAQKARIGLTDNGKLTAEWNSDVAQYELQQMLNDKDLELSKDEREGLEEAMHACDDGEERVIAHLFEVLQDPSSMISDDLGTVTAPRVIYAWAACRKLCQILNGPATDDRYAKYDKETEEKNDAVQ